MAQRSAVERHSESRTTAYLSAIAIDDFSNIAWMHGNDFQTWHSMTDNALVHAVVSGIQSAGPGQTSDDELNYLTSASLDNSSRRLSIDLNAAYLTIPHML